MFCILGLSLEEVLHLRGKSNFTALLPKERRTRSNILRIAEKYHIYMADSSRVSIAGLNPGNVRYVAECIDKTVREFQAKQ
jgi:aspartate aminotransferase